MIAFETMPLKELTMEYVTTHLMHEMSKRKMKEVQGEDIALVLFEIKWMILFVTRRKNVLLLWQTKPHCKILLQNKKQRR
jgi:hypothetical protein